MIRIKTLTLLKNIGVLALAFCLFSAPNAEAILDGGKLKKKEILNLLLSGGEIPISGTVEPSGDNKILQFTAPIAFGLEITVVESGRELTFELQDLKKNETILPRVEGNIFRLIVPQSGKYQLDLPRSSEEDPFDVDLLIKLIDVETGEVISVVTTPGFEFDLTGDFDEFGERRIEFDIQEGVGFNVVNNSPDEIDFDIFLGNQLVKFTGDRDNRTYELKKKKPHIVVVRGLVEGRGDFDLSISIIGPLGKGNAAKPPKDDKNATLKGPGEKIVVSSKVKVKNKKNLFEELFIAGDHAVTMLFTGSEVFNMTIQSHDFVAGKRDTLKFNKLESVEFHADKNRLVMGADNPEDFVDVFVKNITLVDLRTQAKEVIADQSTFGKEAIRPKLIGDFVFVDLESSNFFGAINILTKELQNIDIPEAKEDPFVFNNAVESENKIFFTPFFSGLDVYVYDLVNKTLQKITMPDFEDLNENQINVEFGANNKALIVERKNNRNERVFIWDLNDNSLTEQFLDFKLNEPANSNGRVRAVAFDGRHIAYTGPEQGGSTKEIIDGVFFLDIQTGVSQQIDSMGILNKDGSLKISEALENKLREGMIPILDIEDGKLIYAIEDAGAAKFRTKIFEFPQ